MSECVLNIRVNSWSLKETGRLAAMKTHSTCEPKHQVMALHGLTWVLSRTVSLILRGHVSTKMKLSFIRNRMSIHLPKITKLHFVSKSLTQSLINSYLVCLQMQQVCLTVC
jgi:hypothetical protein